MPILFGGCRGPYRPGRFVALTSRCAKTWSSYPRKGMIAIDPMRISDLWDPEEKLTLTHAL
jgi:dihydropyrimidinase